MTTVKKASFSKMGLKVEDTYKTTEVNGEEVSIVQFLPTEKKISLVAAAVRNSIVDGVCNRMVLDVSLHFGMVQEYSNIHFTEKMLRESLDTIDKLEATGLMDELIALIPEEEYDYLFNSAEKLAAQTDELLKSSVQGFVAEDLANKQSIDLITETLEKSDLGKALQEKAEKEE